MRELTRDSEGAKQIDAILREWRQGDLALEESWFIHVGDPGKPLSPVAAESSTLEIQALTSEAKGLVVVTQTCDIVRCCIDRPYIEVAPLMQVGAQDFHEVRRGNRPRQTTLPALVAESLVADLDRVMTVEKSIVASWRRTPGWSTDAESRAFATALARKRQRFAFPDDFVSFAKKLQDRLKDKHNKDSDEGRLLRALPEIRVRAAPAWDANEIDLWPCPKNVDQLS